MADPTAAGVIVVRRSNDIRIEKAQQLPRPFMVPIQFGQFQLIDTPTKWHGLGNSSLNPHEIKLDGLAAQSVDIPYHACLSSQHAIDESALVKPVSWGGTPDSVARCERWRWIKLVKSQQIDDSPNVKAQPNHAMLRPKTGGRTTTEHVERGGHCRPPHWSKLSSRSSTFTVKSKNTKR